jgi:alpha-1,3-rhamnosyl/mannosyltransferase
MAFTGLEASRVTAVPLGVSAAYAPRLEEEIADKLRKYDLRFGAYALCVSTLEPRKKIAQLLNAWELLPAALRRAFPLMLVGSRGWLSETLQEKIQCGTAQGWVRYLGYVPEPDLPALYAGAAVFVYPSTYEGFGLPPVEAMACGVPVVVSRHSCLPEVTQGAALLVEPNDVPAFAAALEKSLTDESWRLHAASAGRAVAATYTWQRCVDETVKVYRRAVSGE